MNKCMLMRKSFRHLRYSGIGWLTPIYSRESALCLVSFLIPLSWTLPYKSPGRRVDYMPGDWSGGGGRNISHLSCLRDKAVCQSSHINNVTGRNVPGLWRSHGSLLIPFDWGNDLHCWTQRDDISLAAFRQSKEIRQPLTPTPLQLHLSSDHPPHISLCIFLFCLFCLRDIFLERKSAAVLSRRWIR